MSHQQTVVGTDYWPSSDKGGEGRDRDISRHLLPFLFILVGLAKTWLDWLLIGPNLKWSYLIGSEVESGKSWQVLTLDNNCQTFTLTLKNKVKRTN